MKMGVKSKRKMFLDTEILEYHKKGKKKEGNDDKESKSAKD